MSAPIPISVRGVVYPSFRACARAFSISHQAVCDAVERGRTDYIGLGKNWWHKKPQEETQ